METLQLHPNQQSQTTEIVSNNEILRCENNKLTYDEFFWCYMHANTPLVLTAISNNWESKNWLKTIKKDGLEKKVINFDYLMTIKNVKVPVADCSKEYFNSHAKLETPFHDFLIYWSAINKEHEKHDSKNENASEKNLYLKDWHLKAAMPNYNFYSVPKYFASDFLNEYLVESNQDDYRFVYMGPKNSWTPFHADVFGSYSWSTNIFGCKKWILLPPGEELKLTNNGKLPFKIDEALLIEKGVKFFTVFQEENEAVFVPSGWYHQVMNLTDTISVNHNFFNACNLKSIWNNLFTNLIQVIAEIEDCRQMDNFNEHCQIMLRASFGMNFLDFLDILEYIIKKRQVENNGNEKSSNKTDNLLFQKYILNHFHKVFDLLSVKETLECIINNEFVCSNLNVIYQKCFNLFELIKGNLT